MKSTTFPMFCATALAAMTAAGLSHWWSVRQFVALVETGLPISNPVKPELSYSVAPVQSVPMTTSGLLSKQSIHAPAAQPADIGLSQKEFYEALITKMQGIQNQNRDLLDQLAETNRDLMKLEFRVDTHSESFRPLPTSEERPDTSLEYELESGVLPPRAEAVKLRE